MAQAWNIMIKQFKLGWRRFWDRILDREAWYTEYKPCKYGPGGRTFTMSYSGAQALANIFGGMVHWEGLGERRDGECYR